MAPFIVEVVRSVLGFLRENGYACEWDAEYGDEWAEDPVMKVWSGARRGWPIMYMVQFVGLLPIKTRAYRDNQVNIWCSYVSGDGLLGIFDTLQTFDLDDPGFFGQLLEYFAFHDGKLARK